MATPTWKKVNDGTQDHYIHPSKVVHLNSAEGEDWPLALLGSRAKVADYIAPGLTLTIEKPEGITFTSTMSVDHPLQSLIDKLSKGTPGKIARAVQAVTDVTTGIKASTGKSADMSLENIRVMPPNVRFQTSLSQLPAWKESAAAGVSDIKFEFHFGQAGVFDGRTEVYNPVVLLSRVNVPDLVGGNSHMLKGPLPSVAYIYGALGGAASYAVAQIGRNIGTSLGGSNDNATTKFETQVDNLLTGMENDMWKAMQGFKGILSLRLGNRIFIPQFTVEQTKYEFSTEMDDNGFPIYGWVTWSGIKTIQMVNTSMPQYQLYGPGAVAKKAAFDPVAAEDVNASLNSKQITVDANALPVQQSQG